MILCDAGPLVALIDRRDQMHVLCTEVTADRPDQTLITTWPCLTEAFFLLGRAADPRGLEMLGDMWEMGVVRIHEQTLVEQSLIRRLMRKYADVPMSLADASLVSAANQLKTREIFTIDHHFHIYRLPDGSAFDVVP